MTCSLLRSFGLVLSLVAAMSASAAPSLALATEFPGWSIITGGERRAEVVATAQPLSRPHAFSCRSPEAFVRSDLMTIEAALPFVLPYLGEGLGEEIVDVDADQTLRVSVLSGPGMMFDRMLVFLRLEDGVWLLVC
jgi:hypothetical protein